MVILFFIFHFSIHFFHFLIFTLPFSFLVEISVFIFYFSVFVFDFHFGKVKSGKVKNKNEITIWPPWTSVGFELSQMMTIFKPLTFAYRSRRSKRIAAPRVRISVSCSRLSDSGENAKVESTRKVGWARKRNQRKTIVNSWERCLEIIRWLSTLVFPQ